jgi:DNA-binding PadR family transcriptional regulator
LWIELKKHQHILDDLESNNLIIKNELSQGKRRTITIYKATAKGLKFYSDILQSYEKILPRKVL